MKEGFFLQLRETLCAIATTLINLRRPASPIAISTGRSGLCSYRQRSREITHSREHGFHRDDACKECVRLKIKARQSRASLGRARSRLASPSYTTPQDRTSAYHPSLRFDIPPANLQRRARSN